MTAQIIPFPQDAVTLKGDHTITTSLAVAQVFSKQHKDVLKAIRNLECSEEFGRRNFAPSFYINEQGKSQPMYDMTRNGWTMLAMGFTGPEASKFKEAYIALFDAMERELHQDNSYNFRQYRLTKSCNRHLKQVLLDTSPRLAKVYRYLIMGLNYKEIARLCDCSDHTVRRDAKRLAECGMLRFPSQFVPGQTKGKNYPRQLPLIGSEI